MTINDNTDGPLVSIGNEFYLSQSTLEGYYSHNSMLIDLISVSVLVYVCGFAHRHLMGLSLLWPHRGVIVKLCRDPLTN